MLTPISPALPPELLRTLDPVCDAFETAWKEGRPPVIEDYLGNVADTLRSLLLEELVRLELEWRCRRGDQPTVEEYRGRFAAAADTIEIWLTEARQAAATLTHATDTVDSAAPRTPATFSPAPPAAGPPRVLGEYELLEPIGAGGMGEVYRARHKRLDKLVAVKILPAQSQDSAVRTARFLREMKAVGSLDHPHVVEAHDAGEQDGIAYLVMKLIEGQDLSRVVKARGPLPVAEACELARQTALGLAYLHERGLIHRDLKPSNLMRTPEGTVKILDLGLARWRLEGKGGDDLTGSGMVMGTPDFQAPEQALRATTVDIRADLYALGATLFFLLTGRAPFAHHVGVFEKLTAHQGEPPPDVRRFCPEAPAGLADLLDRLLAKSPDDRPQTPAEVAAALAAFTPGAAPVLPQAGAITVTLPGQAGFPSGKSTVVEGRGKRLHWRLNLTGRRFRVGCSVAIAACVLLAALPVALVLTTMPERPRPNEPLAMSKMSTLRPAAVDAAPPKLAVLSLDVTHFATMGKFDQDRGVLGKRSFDTRRDDSVMVEARLSRPAYAFVIAFRPDGTEELCFPEQESEPPPLTDRPRYPLAARGVNYGLNEGEGLQVFAVVASNRPLPAYQVWRPKCMASPWKKAATAPGVVWWDNGNTVKALTGDDPGVPRGKGQEIRGKTPLVELTDWLRRCPEVETAAAVGFAVLPKKALSARVYVLRAATLLAAKRVQTRGEQTVRLPWGLGVGAAGLFLALPLLLGVAGGADKKQDRSAGREAPEDAQGQRTGRVNEPRSPAASTSRPQWQRQLPDEEARQAAAKEGKVMQLQEAGKFAEALAMAGPLARRRAEVQGKEHWQANTARWEVEAIRRVLRQPEDIRQQFARTYTWQRQFKTLKKNGQHQEALPLAEKILNSCRQVLGEDHPRTAARYHDVGSSLFALGHYGAAAEADGKALAITRQALGEEHPNTGVSYNNLANHLAAQGQHAAAAPGFARALAIWRAVLGEEHALTATGYTNVAYNLYAQGQYAAAEPLYARALAIRRQALGEEHPLTAASYDMIAVNLNAQRQFAAAAENYARALAIRRKVLGDEHPETAQSYNNVASNLSDQGKYAEAAPGLSKALALIRKVRGEEHPDTTVLYNNVAVNLRMQGKHAEAAAHFARALALRRQLLGEEHPDTAASYHTLAGNLDAQGKYAEAEAVWLVAADRFAGARLRIAAAGLDRSTITSERTPLPYLAAVLARNGKPALAWQRFEESLARGTWDDLSARLRRPAAEQARQAEFVARLSRLDQLIEQTFRVKEPTTAQLQHRKELLTERRQVQDALDTFARHLEATYGPAAGQVFEQVAIQTALPADAALVGWLDLPAPPKAADPNGEHWAVVLRSKGVPVWVRLRGSGPEGRWTEADTQLPADLREALHTPRGDWQPLAQRLRRQRLEPLVNLLAANDDLPAVRHLMVLPATALAGVPVEVFADGYTVSYALSGTLHAHLHAQPPLTTHGLLALADPVFEIPTDPKVASAVGGNDTWPPLPGTRVEIEALRRLFPAEPAPLLLSDSGASEQRLYELAQKRQLGQYRYLHFATHGEVNDRFPLQSALILARDRLPDPGQQLAAGLPVYDGRLTARKVLEQWHLQSELVTLSACQTALGKFESGEGFVGFAQALLLAGSRSVVLSQWKVDDAATALLMDRFYQNLLGKRADLKGPMRKAAALAEAKTWLRTLSRDEAMQRTAQLSRGVARAKGRPAQPLLPAVPAAPAETREAPPYSHPYYWAAFVLIGDPN